MLKVKVKDFQSVQEADLEVSGFTVLVGRSNLGKSAIIRAVRALLDNQPGEAFVRKGAPFSEVELSAPGLNVRWKKGGGHNAYQINGLDYVDVGRGAPLAVAEAGWGDLHVADGEDPLPVQVADQFEPLFLLNRKGAYAAKVLSDVEQVERLQACLTAAEKDRRTARATLKVRQQDLQDVRAELTAQGDLAPAEAAVKDLQQRRLRLEGLQHRLGAMEAHLDRGASLFHRLKTLQDRLEACQSAADALGPPPTAEAFHRFAAGAPRMLGQHAHLTNRLRKAEALSSRAWAALERDLPAASELLRGGAAFVERAGRVSKALSIKEARCNLLTDKGLGEPPPPPPVLSSKRGSEYLASWARLSGQIRSGIEARAKMKAEADSLSSEIEAVEALAPPCPTCGRLTASHPHSQE